MTRIGQSPPQYPINTAGGSPQPPGFSSQQLTQLCTALTSIANKEMQHGTKEQKTQWASLAKQVSQLQSDVRAGRTPSKGTMDNLHRTLASLNVSGSEIQRAGGPKAPPPDQFHNPPPMGGGVPGCFPSLQPALPGNNALDGLGAQGAQPADGVDDGTSDIPTIAD
jgi:hypothetical protein